MAVEEMLSGLWGSEKERWASARYFRRELAADGGGGFGGEEESRSGGGRGRLGGLGEASVVRHLVPGLLALLKESPSGEGERVGDEAEEEGMVDALWGVTNLLCGSEAVAHAVVEGGGIGLLLNQLRSGRWMSVRSQALWALANVAGDCDACRHLLYQSNFLDDLKSLIGEGAREAATKKSLTPTAVWAISNICRGRPRGWALEEVGTMVPSLSDLLHRSDESETMRTDAAWALAYLAEGEPQASLVLQPPVLKSLVGGVNEGGGVGRGCLRALGNLVTGGDWETGAVVEAGGVEALGALLERGKELSWNLRKECLWALSNIAAGTENQVAAVLDSGTVLALVVGACGGEEGGGKVGREAAWVLANAAAGGSQASLRRLLVSGAGWALGRELEAQKDPSTQRAFLSALSALRHASIPPPLLSARLADAALPRVLRKVASSDHSPASLKRQANRLLPLVQPHSLSTHSLPSYITLPLH